MLLFINGEEVGLVTIIRENRNRGYSGVLHVQYKDVRWTSHFEHIHDVPGSVISLEIRNSSSDSVHTISGILSRFDDDPGTHSCILEIEG